MPKYHVHVREVHVNTIEVEAEDMHDAISKANLKLEDGSNSSMMLEYSHTMGTDFWTVEKVDE